MQNLDHYLYYVAYAAGFATGNYVGMIIEERLAMGIQMIRIFANSKGPELMQMLNRSGYGTTSVEAHGAKEHVHLIYTIVHRTEISNVLDVINRFNPKAFYTIEDIISVNEGIFPRKEPNASFPFRNVLRQWRKGK